MVRELANCPALGTVVSIELLRGEPLHSRTKIRWGVSDLVDRFKFLIVSGWSIEVELADWVTRVSHFRIPRVVFVFRRAADNHCKSEGSPVPHPEIPARSGTLLINYNP
jgi:hypothetical protein